MARKSRYIRYCKGALKVKTNCSKKNSVLGKLKQLKDKEVNVLAGY